MDDEETRHRRLRLGELVEACFGGEQKALRQHIAARTKKEPNQGEISGLLKLDNSARSFGDKKAKNLTDQIGLHRRWFDMPLGANLRREQWLSESVIGRAAAEDVAHAADLLPSPNGESPEHPAQSPENNKGLVMQSNVVRLQREGAATEDGYIRMELLSPTPSAGRGKLVSEAPYVVRHLDVLESWARTTLGCADPSRVKLLTCVGDSMEGTIKDRDVVFVDLAQNCFTHPGIYVLSVGENLLVKRLDMTVTGDLEVISDNREKYAAQRVHAADLSQVSVAGKVVGWWTLRNS